MTDFMFPFYRPLRCVYMEKVSYLGNMAEWTVLCIDLLINQEMLPRVLTRLFSPARNIFIQYKREHRPPPYDGGWKHMSQA